MLLVRQNDPILRTPCVEFDFANPQLDVVQFAKDLVYMMYELNGIGLSANQVGYNLRIFALRGHPENFVCVNPKIVNASEQSSYIIEGCLTFPGLAVKIKRADEIRVRFAMPNGDTRTETFRGLTAHAFQHEMDHMNGELFYMKATKYHRDQAFKNWKK